MSNAKIEPDYVESPGSVAEYNSLCAQRDFSAGNPCPNSCSNCRFENTCAYAYDKGRRYGPCILGFMSNGERFFQPRAV